MNNTFKRILALLLVLCMSSALLVCASAEGTVDPSANMSVSASVSGTTVTAVVSINCNTAFRGASFKLNYDSSKLTYASATSGISGTAFSDNGSAINCVAESSTDLSSCTLATFTFNVVAGARGSTTLSLSKPVVSDPTGTVSIPCSVGSTSVDVADYLVSVSAATNGTITSNVSGARAGNTVTLTTKGNSGYVVDTVSVTTAGGSTVAVSSNGDTHTFTMPSDDVTVSATFKPIDYLIKKGTVSEGGTISIDKTGANVGETITVTATPSEFYEVGTVTVSGATVTNAGGGKFTFVMPASDVTVNATFTAKSYTITKGAADNGAISVNSTAAYKSTVSFTVTANNGYAVKSVSVVDAAGTAVSVSGKDGKYSFTMPGSNVTVSATMEKAAYTVTLNAVSNGTASVSATTAGYGDTVTITASANENFTLQGVSVKDAAGKSISVSGKDGKYSFVMPASNVKITVGTAGKSFAIKVDNVKNGKIEVSETGAYTSTVAFKVTADEGYKIGSVAVYDAKDNEISVSGAEGSYSFKMPASKVRITAEFVADEYTITTEASENGSFTVDAQTAAMDTVINVTTAPAEGFQVNSLTITDAEGNPIGYTGENDAYTFVMPASNVTVAVTFEEIPTVTFGVTTNPTENGTITLSKDNAGAGSTVTITAAPAAGYKVASVSVIDASGNTVALAGSGNVFTFEMPESEVTVSATFVVDESQIEPTPVPSTPKISPLIWILPIIVIIVGAVVVILLLKNKKKDEDFEDDDEDDDE